MNSAESFAREFDVSRETLERLQHYHTRLLEWSKRINLVSRSTLDQVWARHFADSAQISRLIPANTTSLLDLGSGAGFPGLIIGILRSDIQRMTLIESDVRKCAFLRTIARETETEVSILSERIEEAPKQNAQIITARALAHLSDLLPLADRHLAESGHCLFLKGNSWQEELTAAAEGWHMDAVSTPSLTDSGSAVLKIGALRRVGSG